jgi:hypothetical protein
MSTTRNAVLAAYNTGDTPTEAQFANWINLCKFGVTQTRAQIQALIAASNLDTNTIYQLTGGPSSNVLIVFPTAANAISDAAINLTTGEFGEYDITGNTFTAQGGSGSFLPLAGGSLTGTVNDAKGTDIASAGTTNIAAATGNYVVVTGTTTITALGTAQAGAVRIVRFSGALILTHNATSLILPTTANITTAAGDVAVFVSEGSGNWRCTGYLRANGQALAGGGGGGVTTMAAIGATPNANGATITGGTTLNLQPADASFGGVVTTAAQTFAGIKTFSAAIAISGSTGSVPLMVLTPTSGVTITGTTNGSIWCDTVSSNTSLTMRKDSGYTKIITAERNPDFATGSSSGLLVADTSGNLTKSADLTALGVFAQTSSVTVVNTATSTTLLGTLTGSATLPANFFGVGKTIKIYVSGTYSQDTGSQDCALKLTIGGVAVGTITFTHNGGLTNVFFDAEFTLTCRTAGATGTLQFMGIGRLNHSGTDLLNFFQVSATSGSIDTTGTLAIDLQADWVTADADNSITASIVTTTFLN